MLHLKREWIYDQSKDDHLAQELILDQKLRRNLWSILAFLTKVKEQKKTAVILGICTLTAPHDARFGCHQMCKLCALV
jgi:hypothetical protein